MLLIRAIGSTRHTILRLHTLNGMFGWEEIREKNSKFNMNFIFFYFNLNISFR